ncbi:hypothetical protein P691DRAFT_757875 [Macrolepiota fuliginosa MF-IS2]|uniref:Uncharacterized protein n=1 Tax=Macrolepiota fuliginosa MF-IS2 TaxID=1400762 RepID=A0A9P6C435_9AGAR|nr:hypothetical protein P691DRAFT_757875 [Macrolepiota fuliginosa MF-IS2]
MSLGRQNLMDDDYPRHHLVPELQLTDPDTDTTRAVTAPWLHALYTMTHREQPTGVTEVILEEAQFSNSFTWQHFTILCVFFTQCILGFWAARGDRGWLYGFPEASLILFSILLRAVEGYISWISPVHKDPRPVARSRKYVVHIGSTTGHFLIISHRPRYHPRTLTRPYVNLEDAAAPRPILRKGIVRTALRFADVASRLGYILSAPSGPLILAALIIGSVTSKVIMIHTPLPLISLMRSLETPGENPSRLDLVTVVCRHIGHVSDGFVEVVRPDIHGIYVDDQRVREELHADSILVSKTRKKQRSEDVHDKTPPIPEPELLFSLTVVEEIVPEASTLLITNLFGLKDDTQILYEQPLGEYDAIRRNPRRLKDVMKFIWRCCLKVICSALPRVSSLTLDLSEVPISFLPGGADTLHALQIQLFNITIEILLSAMFDNAFGPDFHFMVPEMVHFWEFLEHTGHPSSWLVWIQRHVPPGLRDNYASEMRLGDFDLTLLRSLGSEQYCLETIVDKNGNIVVIYCSRGSHEDFGSMGVTMEGGGRDEILEKLSELKSNVPSTKVTIWGRVTHKCALINQSLPNGYSWIYYFSYVPE